MAKLTHAKIKNLTKPGRYGDADGLHLRVSKGGAKAFVLRKIVDGRRRDIPLGRWPDMTLADARQRASELRLMIGRGEYQPEKEPEKATMPTFRQAAAEVYELNKPRWRNEKHVKNWWQSMEKYAFPSIGDMPVDEIDRTDVLEIFSPIWTNRPERARRLRQRMRSVFRWCEGHDYISSNPCGDGLDGVLPRVPRPKNRFRSLPYQEIPQALDVIESCGASLSARLCFRLMVLLALRSGETRNLTWDMVDEEQALLVIPAHQMKMNAEHRTPLAREAVEVIERAKALRDERNLLFPSPTGRGVMSDMTMTAIIRRVGLNSKTTCHGFRHAYKNWASEQGYDYQLSELQLAHALPGLQSVYLTSDLLDRRRVMMSAYASFVCGTERAKVVSLHG